MSRTIATFCALLLALTGCAKAAYTEIPACDSRIIYVGRTLADDGGVSFNWTATTIRICFTGKYLAIQTSDTGKNWFDVWIDGSTDQSPALTVATYGEKETIVLCDSDTKATRSVTIRKRTEGEQGVTTFHKILTDGELLQAEGLAPRMLEFVGDSYTCGYGADSQSRNERFSPETENANHSYSAIVSRYFGADYIAIAHSGRGVVRNYGGADCPTMTDLYSHTFDNEKLAKEDTSLWDNSKSAFRPAATVIMLGTNDFSCGEHPELSVWIDGYITLIKNIKANYGDAHPILCCAARGSSKMHDYVRAAVEACTMENVTFLGHGESIFPDSEYGADDHPTYAAHLRYAYAVIPYISTITAWPMKEINDIR
ncbi:MAG: SGNH/GDSL hydrolase family protein [Bacteroidales bacterium]|nr:SGNH/GDSL hydrolase family protein [Bacteroidales bacterium]